MVFTTKTVLTEDKLKNIIRGRPPNQMKKLASLVLSEGWTILDKPNLIGERLKIKYDNASALKQRFLKKSNHSYLCPEDLKKMVLLEDGELTCQKCGYTYNFPKISQPSVYNVDIQLFPLGNYRERFGEL